MIQVYQSEIKGDRYETGNKTDHRYCYDRCVVAAYGEAGMKRRVPVKILSAAGVLGCLIFLTVCIIWNGYYQSQRGRPVSVSRETEEIISSALQMADNTEGVLEPAVYPVLTAWGFTTDENRIPADDEIPSLLEHVGYNRVQMEEGSVSFEDEMCIP